MHVIFVEPRFPANQAQFVRGLKEAGAYVTGIGETPWEYLGDRLRGWLDAYDQIPSVVDRERLHDAVRTIQKRGPWVDRLEATVEAHILPAARVREACGIPGTSVRTAFLCRDKPAMKEALREAGVPVAASTGTDDPVEALRFSERTGYPVVVKPRSAAGAAGTHRVDGPNEMKSVLEEAGVGRGASVAIEEFVDGHEGFFDTLTLDGDVVHHFVSHYYPNVLEAMRNRWISPQVITTNRVGAEGYEEVRRLATKVHETLDIGTSATHMEWFFGSKGLKFSEIGCRPPGVSVWDLYCYANEMDLYREWAELVVHERPHQKPSRRYAAGMIALRPDRDGRIFGYEGIEEVHDAIGEWVLDAHFPPPGAPTQPIEGGYMANAWVRVRHPDYDRLRELLGFVGETIQVRAR